MPLRQCALARALSHAIIMSSTVLNVASPSQSPSVCVQPHQPFLSQFSSWSSRSTMKRRNRRTRARRKQDAKQRVCATVRPMPWNVRRVAEVQRVVRISENVEARARWKRTKEVGCTRKSEKSVGPTATRTARATNNSKPDVCDAATRSRSPSSSTNATTCAGLEFIISQSISLLLEIFDFLLHWLLPEFLSQSPFQSVLTQIHQIPNSSSAFHSSLSQSLLLSFLERVLRLWSELHLVLVDLHCGEQSPQRFSVFLRTRFLKLGCPAQSSVFLLLLQQPDCLVEVGRDVLFVDHSWKTVVTGFPLQQILLRSQLLSIFQVLLDLFLLALTAELTSDVSFLVALLSREYVLLPLSALAELRLVLLSDLSLTSSELLSLHTRVATVFSLLNHSFDLVQNTSISWAFLPSLRGELVVRASTSWWLLARSYISQTRSNSLSSALVWGWFVEEEVTFGIDILELVQNRLRVVVLLEIFVKRPISSLGSRFKHKRLVLVLRLPMLLNINRAQTRSSFLFSSFLHKSGFTDTWLLLHSWLQSLHTSTCTLYFLIWFVFATTTRLDRLERFSSENANWVEKTWCFVKTGLVVTHTPWRFFKRHVVLLLLLQVSVTPGEETRHEQVFPVLTSDFSLRETSQIRVGRHVGSLGEAGDVRRLEMWGRHVDLKRTLRASSHTRHIREIHRFRRNMTQIERFVSCYWHVDWSGNAVECRVFRGLP